MPRPSRSTRTLALAALVASLTISLSCRRTEEGQTAILLTLSSAGPIDCVVLSEQAFGGSTPTRELLDAKTGLPPAFRTDAWKTAKLTALIYSGNALGEGSITLDAEGHRNNCAGPVVARMTQQSATFVTGQVVNLTATMGLLGVDADHDGWPAGEDCDDNDPSTYPGAPEVCDGKDHSCSGVIDAGCACTGSSRPCYPLGLASNTIGVGLCHAGVQSCVSGKWDSECAGAVVPAPERCDDQDHDCDGTKGLPSCPCKPGEVRQCFTKGPIALAGVGRCAWGQQSCGADGFFSQCEGDVGPLPYEICNGIDDNCDGTVDEVADKNGKPIMVRPSCSKTEGVCAGAVKRCVNGAFATCDDSDYLSAALANGSAYGPDVNYCDGADHDCDGTSDTGCTGCPVLGATRDCYGPGLNSPTLHHTPCRKGTETCVRSGNTSKWGVCSGQVEPTSEICDGVDNDCDGNVDDLVKNEGTLCNTGKPGVCGPGVRRCVNGNLDCTSITPASTEVCNGLDDDCDGRIDQTFDKLHDPQHCGGVNECVQCASGDACCDGRCADLRSDSNDCGTCGNVCAPGSGCCAGVCVDLSSDTSCGACTIECKDGESCKNGACQGTKEVRCDNGLDDDGDHLTDCADPDCAGLRCDQVGGTCQSGQCVHETNCSNGVDDDHNGKTDCADPACTGQRCAGNGICTASGACVKEICDNGIDDNGDGKIDCQDSLACPPPVAGTGLPIQEACCGVKWADLLGDVANCGGCGNDCRAGHDATCGTIACVQGRCAYNTSSNGTTCNGSGKCCDGACIGSFDHGDPNNCGGCGVKCPAPTGACQEAVCNAGGHCGFAPSCEVASCDLQSCITGGQAGLCTDGACCTGCVDSASDLCKGGTDLHACRGPTGYCADCATSNNPCITDACGPNGCTHNANSSACDVNGQAGTCNNGACCIGCIDAGGACHQIDSTHCGVPGGACVLSCDDGESCTQDLCHSTGTGAPFCTNPGLPDGAGCVSANKGGVCQGASCCTGCLDISSNGSAACLALGSQSATKCGASGVSCQTCPAPGECQSASTCTNGTCGFTNKPDGTLCRGGLGFCSGGQCKL